jgi:hypothetical protein
MKEAIPDAQNQNTAPYENPRLSSNSLSGLLTWSDLTPLAWVSPRAHFKPFMALAIHKRLKLNVPVSVPGTVLSPKYLVPLSQAVFGIKLSECRSPTAPCPRLRARYTLSTGRNSPAGSVDAIPTGSTPAQRFVTSDDKRPRYRNRSVHQIRPEAGFGPKMGPGPKKADFGRGGQICRSLGDPP